MAKSLTPEEAKEIPRMIEEGLRMPEIAKRLGISYPAVRLWIARYRQAMHGQGIKNPLPILTGRPPIKPIL